MHLRRVGVVQASFVDDQIVMVAVELVVSAAVVVVTLGEPKQSAAPSTVPDDFAVTSKSPVFITKLMLTVALTRSVTPLTVTKSVFPSPVRPRSRSVQGRVEPDRAGLDVADLYRPARGLVSHAGPADFRPSPLALPVLFRNIEPHGT